MLISHDLASKIILHYGYYPLEKHLVLNWKDDIWEIDQDNYSTYMYSKYHLVTKFDKDDPTRIPYKIVFRLNKWFDNEYETFFPTKD